MLNDAHQANNLSALCSKGQWLAAHQIGSLPRALIRGLGMLAKEGTKLETVVTALIRIQKHEEKKKTNGCHA